MATVGYEHVMKRYGRVTAVDDLTLGVEDGEFMVLVGPSGCGKSTVLRLTAGLEQITSGTLSIGERHVNDVPPRDRDVAMVFQNYALYPHLTVYENVAFGLKVRGTPRADLEARVRRVAELLGIGELLTRKPAQLSGGQRQRVALGRAIVREPRVFLMDEPLSNLDAKLRVQTRAELIRLHQRLATTTLYVTHDQVEAMTMGQRVAVMRDGAIQQVAHPSVLYAEPANVFVAGFIGTLGMNFFSGTLTRDESGQLHVRCAGFELPLGASHGACGLAAGQSVILGIRPEYLIDPRDAGGRAAASIRGRVNVVEPLGAEAFGYLQGEDGEFIARYTAAHAPRLGETVAVAVVPDRVHMFDPRSEAALCHLSLIDAPAISA
jgi:multiple sugar transport system ATP-binding protein